MLKRCLLFCSFFLLQNITLNLAAQKPGPKNLYKLTMPAGEEILILLSQDKIDRKIFAQNFQTLFLNKFIPRATSLTCRLFPLFSPEGLTHIYKAIIESFNEKIVWFYVGDSKSDLTADHLDLLAKELLIYLEYLEKKGIKAAWLKNKDANSIKDIYYELVVLAFCYQIKRISAVLLRWEITFSCVMRLSGDPLRKASLLVNKLKQSSFHEQATDILKNYEIIISNLSNNCIDAT